MVMQHQTSIVHMVNVLASDLEFRIAENKQLFDFIAVVMLSQVRPSLRVYLVLFDGEVPEHNDHQHDGEQELAQCVC